MTLTTIGGSGGKRQATSSCVSASQSRDGEDLNQSSGSGNKLEKIKGEILNAWLKLKRLENK